MDREADRAGSPCFLRTDRRRVTRSRLARQGARNRSEAPPFRRRLSEETVDSSFDNVRAVMCCWRHSAVCPSLLRPSALWRTGYDVSQRTREIIACAAPSVRREGRLPTSCDGIVEGWYRRRARRLIGAALLSSAMTTCSFNVRPGDPKVWAVSSAESASRPRQLLPARRAARGDDPLIPCATIEAELISSFGPRAADVRQAEARPWKR